MHNLFLPRTSTEIETHRRIKLSIWAYAYEFCDVSVVDDFKFDQEAKKVNLAINTARRDLDEWFRNNFNSYTGSWIQNHPELDKIERIYNERYRN